MRVLFVEDEGDSQLLVGDGLRLYGFNVRVVEDDVAAIRAIQDDEYDAIVTDYAMPRGVTGIDVAEEARRRQPSVLVVIVSGFARAQLPKLPDGVRYVAKPYRLVELVRALKEVRD